MTNQEWQDMYANVQDLIAFKHSAAQAAETVWADTAPHAPGSVGEYVRRKVITLAKFLGLK
jgi:hypothetical protein